MLSEVLLTSLQITGIWILFQDGMIFNPLVARYDNAAWTKPLFSCLICMSLFWGSFFWVAQWSCNFNILLFVLAVTGVNTVLNSVIDYFRNSPYFEK